MEVLTMPKKHVIHLTDKPYRTQVRDRMTRLVR